MTTHIPDRRLDRSPYIDQALEKLLTHLRQEFGCVALVLADEDGHLVADSAEEGVTPELSGLGALSADLRTHLSSWSSLSPPAGFRVEGPGNTLLSGRYFVGAAAALAVVAVADGAVVDALFDRARQGVLRILNTGDMPA